MTDTTTEQEQLSAAALRLLFAQVSFAPPVSELTAAAPPPVPADRSAPAPGDAEVSAPTPQTPRQTRGDRRSRLRTAHREAVARAAAEGVVRPTVDDTATFVAGLRAEIVSFETRSTKPSLGTSILRSLGITWFRSRPAARGRDAT